MNIDRKMVMALIPRAEAGRVVKALVAAGFTATIFESRGGVLQQAQKALFIVVRADQLEAMLAIIRENCRHEVTISASVSGPAAASRPVTAELGGAIIFVWSIDRMENY